MTNNRVHPTQRRATALFSAAFLWLCLLFTGCGEEPPPKIVEPPPDISSGAISLDPPPGATGTKSIFEQYEYQKVHGTWQKSYLNLVQKIMKQSAEGPIDTREQRFLFSEYNRAKRNYEKISQKIEDYEKDQKLRCFANMKSLIRAIIYYDRKNEKKMFIYDFEKLKEQRILFQEPRCPENGQYRIISKDGQRFFHCSIHGTLRH